MRPYQTGASLYSLEISQSDEIGKALYTAERPKSACPYFFSVAQLKSKESEDRKNNQLSESESAFQNLQCLLCIQQNARVETEYIGSLFTIFEVLGKEEEKEEMEEAEK